MDPEQPVTQQPQLIIYTHQGIKIFQINNLLLQSTLTTIINQFIQIYIGYSSRIFLYQQPLCPFNKLDFLSYNLTLKQLLSSFTNLCFTFNNTQYAQQPNYHLKSSFSRPLTPDSIQIIIQICQNNFFFHENYRLPLSTRIHFIMELASRLGNNIYIQYYNTRLNLLEFAKDSLIQHTIAKFLDETNRLTITVDSTRMQNNNATFQQIPQKFPINSKFYFTLCIVDTNDTKKYYAINRKCKLNSLCYLLKINLKQHCNLYNNFTEQQLQQQIPPQSNLIVVYLKKSLQKLIKITPPIKTCQIIGTIPINNQSIQIFIIQRSVLLYRLLIDTTSMQCHTLSTSYLPCPPTSTLDQDLFFLRNTQLIGYSITINTIKIKYYTSNGDLLIIKQFPWYHTLYEIQYSVVDFFCVRLKNSKRKVRAFYIEDPENYLEIQICDKFFPAKLANNIYSDSSGLFAITNSYIESIQIYSLKDKTRLLQLKPQNYRNLTDIFFSPHTTTTNDPPRTIYLNYKNTQINIYTIPTGDHLLNILCQKNMNNFFCIGNHLACTMGSQIKIFRKQSPDEKISFPNWKQTIYIPEKTVIITKSTNKYELLIKQTLLQFDSFNQFYIY